MEDCKNESVEHVVLVIGWDANSWTVMNSYGLNWGSKGGGFGRITQSLICEEIPAAYFGIWKFCEIDTPNWLVIVYFLVEIAVKAEKWIIKKMQLLIGFIYFVQFVYSVKFNFFHFVFKNIHRSYEDKLKR